MTEKTRNRIIRLGKANDALNKYSLKLAIGPAVVGAMLIILHKFVEEPSVMLWGIGLLLLGCLIPMVWFVVLSIRAGFCKEYSYGLYQTLVEEASPKEIEVRNKELPLTQKIADEQFDGDIQQAITYILHAYANEELNEFIHEWGSEESRIALDHIWSSVKERVGEKEAINYLKDAAALDELGMTEEDVIAAPNPYKKKVWIQLCVLAAVCVSVPVLLGLLEEWCYIDDTVREWGMYLLACYITLQATTIGTSLVGTVKYCVLKKRLRKARAKEAEKEK